MDTALVTGANGHLGHNLTSQLAASGYHVRAGVRQPTLRRQDRPPAGAGRAGRPDRPRRALDDQAGG
jgi:uncharacterized protein YbjT (DUF2867 family)